jgi:hypothetical protein
MACAGMIASTAIVSLSLFLSGCGLDGVRGTVISVDENRYLIRDYKGNLWNVHADDRSRRDRVQENDEVRVYIEQDGYAAFIQKLEP